MTRPQFAFALFCWVLVSCRKSTPGRGVDDGTAKRYKLKGVVVRRDEAARTVTIRHGPVSNDAGKVWMEAMTMEFPVPGDVDFEKLTTGVAIAATVVSRESDFEYWVEAVQVSAAAVK